MGPEDLEARGRVERCDERALDAVRFRDAWYRRAPVVWRAIEEPRECATWRPDAIAARWGDESATLRWFAVDANASRPRFTSLCTRIEPARLGDALATIERARSDVGELPYLRVSDGRGDLGSSLARMPFPDHLFARDGTGEADWSVHENVLRVGPRDYVYPLHCDNLETVLLQLHGAKEIVLFAPDSIASIYPRDDDATRSSIDDLDACDSTRFPRFTGARRWACVVEPGDAIYIPALWFHEVRARGVTASASRTWRRRDHRGYVEGAKTEAWREWERANRRVY